MIAKLRIVLKMNKKSMRKYLSAICVCMALCFVGCKDDEPAGKGSFYEVTIEQSGDFDSFVKSIEVVADGIQLIDMTTGESYCGRTILGDEKLHKETVTLGTMEKTVKFDVLCSVLNLEEDVQKDPMQWVVIVCKDGEEIDRKTFVFGDDKISGGANWVLHYK